MSGGYFNYKQYELNDIADSIQRVIANNESTEVNSWGEPIGGFLSKEVLERFNETIFWLERSREMVQRVDWFLSGDDSESSFLERWETEVRKV